MKKMQKSFRLYGQNRPRSFVAFILAALCVFIWGITFVNTKALSADFSALEILVLRFLLAYFCLWIFYPKFVRTKNFREESLFAAAGFFGVTFYQFVENVAVTFTYASNVSIIISTCPMLTGIVTQIFLKEKIVTKKFLAGFLICIFGIALVSQNGCAQEAFRISPKGDALALLAAASWALYSLFVAKLNALRYEPVFVTRRTFFWALVFMILLVLLGKITGIKSARFSIDFSLFKKPLNILNLAFLGIGASAFCFFAWSRACLVLSVARTTTGLYFVPVVTILFSAIFLGERLSPLSLAGFVFVVTGLFLSRGEKKNASSQ